MAPVFSSSIRVDPGMPRVSPESKGTETTFMVVPRSEMRAGMKSTRCSGMSIAVLCGDIWTLWE